MALKTDATNSNRVSSRQWKKWSEDQRRLFNRIFIGLQHQELFRATKQTPMEEAHWQVIRWNAAFQGACALGEIVP
jgi:hypothetical protein